MRFYVSTVTEKSVRKLVKFVREAGDFKIEGQ